MSIAAGTYTGPVFDGHVYPDREPGGDDLSSPEGLAAFLDGNGIARVLLVSKDAEALVRLSGSRPGVHGMLWIDPADDRAVAAAEASLRRPEIVGVKLHPGVDVVAPDDPRSLRVIATAGNAGVPVSIHCGHPPGNIFTIPWFIEKAVKRAPDVPIVLAHMGYCLFEYHVASMDMAEQYPNVHLDVTGMPHNWRVRESVDRAGIDRVLYGSAAPGCSAALELAKVRLAELTEDEERHVLHDNAARLFLGATQESGATA